MLCWLHEFLFVLLEEEFDTFDVIATKCSWCKADIADMLSFLCGALLSGVWELV